MPLDDWQQVGQQISQINDSSTWWLGDWLIYGRECYPDRYKRAVEETSLDYQTLRNYAWVAGRFSSERRRNRLSFQHHAEVAAFPPHVQDMWLDKAEEFGWSRNSLRTHMKLNAEHGHRAVAEIIQIRVDIAAEQVRLWKEAASRTESDLLAWMVQVLNEAAGSGADRSLKG
jgi:hypothetical protein